MARSKSHKIVRATKTDSLPTLSSTQTLTMPETLTVGLFQCHAVGCSLHCKVRVIVARGYSRNWAPGETNLANSEMEAECSGVN